MSVSLLLFLIVGMVILALVVPAVARYASQGDDRSELRQAKQQASIATKALRSIANGAGNPIFEAQDALDQIEGTYIKEIN